MGRFQKRASPFCLTVKNSATRRVNRSRCISSCYRPPQASYCTAMSFRALGLDANILKAVQEAGYTEPTPIQSAAIPQILAGHDLIGIAQTGTGKTAAFTLPMLTKLSAVVGDGYRGTRALVLAPTRELVVQIDENVRA